MPGASFGAGVAILIEGWSRERLRLKGVFGEPTIGGVRNWRRSEDLGDREEGVVVSESVFFGMAEVGEEATTMFEEVEVEVGRVLVLRNNALSTTTHQMLLGFGH